MNIWNIDGTEISGLTFLLVHMGRAMSFLTQNGVNKFLQRLSEMILSRKV